MKLISALAFSTALLVQGSAFASTELLSNGSFETVSGLSSGEYGYPCSGCSWHPIAPNAVADWTFNGGAVSYSAGDWNPTAPFSGLGNIYAALQSTSSFYTTFTVSAATSAIISWFDAGRHDYGGVNGNQSYTVSLESATATTLLGTFTTTSDAASLYHEITQALAAGSYKLIFTGSATSDSTAFIDGVSVAAVPGPVAAAGLPGLLALAGFGLYRRRKHAA